MTIKSFYVIIWLFWKNRFMFVYYTTNTTAEKHLVFGLYKVAVDMFLKVFFFFYQWLLMSFHLFIWILLKNHLSWNFWILASTMLYINEEIYWREYKLRSYCVAGCPLQLTPSSYTLCCLSLIRQWIILNSHSFHDLVFITCVYVGVSSSLSD